MNKGMNGNFLAYIGHFNIDIVLRVEKLIDLVSTPVNAVKEQFGGTAGNFSLVASFLDFPFEPVSIISEQSHSVYIKELQKRKINTELIKIVQNSFGPSCYAVTDGSAQKYFMANGPMESEDYCVTDKAYDIIHSSTGIPEKNLSFIESTSHKKVAFDPGQEAGSKYNSSHIRKFIEISDMVISNEHEIGIIQEKSGMNLDDLNSSGIDVVVTRGEKGTTIHRNGKTTKIHGIKMDSIQDTIGAGDSFRAGFYSGLFHTNDMEFAALCGNIVASRTLRDGVIGFHTGWNEIETKAKGLKGTNITRL